MRKMYGSRSWRRVLALVLVFVMMLSIMGTSGYSVFAEDLVETGEEVVVSEPEAVVPEVTEDIQGPSPGEEAEEVAEPVLEAEEGEEPEEAAEAVEEAEEGEELEEAEAVEETEEGEAAEEPAEAAEEEEEGEEPAEAAEAEEGEELEEAEEAEESEEAEEPEEEAAEEEESSEPTLIEEAAQIIEEDDGEPAPEEEAEEAAPAEEIIPEGPTSFEPVEFDDAIVSVTAEPYTFPEGTTVEIEEVVLGRTQVAAVAGVVEEEIVSYKAYDITFYNADGKEIQPAKPVKVNIESPAMAEADNLQVVHIEDNNRKATVVDVDATEEGLEFDAEHFSVYVVVEVGEGARLAVTFKNGDTEIDTMYVKAADLETEDNPDHIDDILCDPGAGSVPEGCLFLGWVEESVYERFTRIPKRPLP